MGEVKRARDHVYVAFLEFAFTSNVHNDKTEKPSCLVCDATLSSEILKGNKLQKAFLSRHKKLEDKPLTYFQWLLENVNSS